ncbi:MAG: hypothetical protein ACXAC6_04990 [Candidatus Hodarchaeales archaeon]|jgi:hypothetical protein
MKQPTPNPEVIILNWESKNKGSITRLNTVSMPIRSINLLEMFFGINIRNRGEKRNNIVKAFSLSDNVIRQRM